MVPVPSRFDPVARLREVKVLDEFNGPLDGLASSPFAFTFGSSLAGEPVR